MTADIRMALENELDDLEESVVESWLHRCFEACDPRYDTDWLMGMFELALMQFPENYEIRAASSKASTMEAQRLFDEGETQEAVSRLERLLESDPYCTEAFEMLERFMQGPVTDSGESGLQPPPSLEPEPTVPPLVLEQPAPVAVAAPEPGLPDSQDDELLSFLDDDLMIDGLQSALPEVAVEAEPAAAFLAEPVSQPAALEPPPAEPVATEPALQPPPPLEPVAEPVVEAIAPPPPVAPPVEPAPVVPPVAVVPPTPVAPPAPVAAPAPIAAAPVAPPPIAPPPVAPAPVAAAPLTPPPTVATQPSQPMRIGAFDWRTVVGLPAHAGSTLEPQLEAILPHLTERFTQVGNYRSLVMLLTDLYQREPSHQGICNNLNSVLSDWASQLEKQGRGPEAGQVAAWAQQLLGDNANWVASWLQRYPAQPPSLPDLGSLTGMAAPNWMNWVAPLRDDPSRYPDAGKALASDPQGLQSLFRHLAVQHPDQPDHVLNLGWAYSHTGQHALAMVHTQRSLQMRQSARAYELLQKVYADLGQPEMAERVAQQLTQLRG